MCCNHISLILQRGSRSVFAVRGSIANQIPWGRGGVYERSLLFTNEVNCCQPSETEPFGHMLQSMEIMSLAYFRFLMNLELLSPLGGSGPSCCRMHALPYGPCSRSNHAGERGGVCLLRAASCNCHAFGPRCTMQRNNVGQPSRVVPLGSRRVACAQFLRKLSELPKRNFCTHNAAGLERFPSYPSPLPLLHNIEGSGV